MVATITKEEEELLIISDDEFSNEIDLNIEKEIKPETTMEPEGELISFGGEENEKKENSTDEINLNFDLGGDDKNVSVEDMLGEKEKNVSESKIETDEQNNEGEDLFSFDIDGGNEEEEAVLNFGESIAEETETDVELVFGNLEEKNEESITDLGKTTEDFLVEKSEEKEVVVETKKELISENKIKDKNEKNISDIKEEEFISDITEITDNKNKNKEKSITKKETKAKAKEEKKTDFSLGKKDDSKSDDTNTILNETIKKLKKRKASIIEIKKESLIHIAELKDNIKDLQSQVRKGNTEVKHHDKEMEKIEENIQLLRKMKV